MLTPFSNFDRTFAQFDRLFGLPTGRPDVAPRGPRFNLEETDAAYRLQGQLPGWSADDFELTVEDGVLTIQGHKDVSAPEGYRVVRRERAGARFERSLRLSDDIDLDGISATARDGLLTVTLPRKPAAAPRRISVQSA